MDPDFLCTSMSLPNRVRGADFNPASSSITRSAKGAGVLRQPEPLLYDSRLFPCDLLQRIPSMLVCSRLMDVMADTFGSTILVESNLPPSPTSTTAKSTFIEAKYKKQGQSLFQTQSEAKFRIVCDPLKNRL